MTEEIDVSNVKGRGRRVAKVPTPVSPTNDNGSESCKDLPFAAPITPPSNSEEWNADEIRRLLAVPKSRDSVPTLTCIDKGFYKRYFILDVDGNAYSMAWEYYKSHKPDGTPEEFVTIVTRILSIDMPRMHRAVSYIPLL
jgi:hypothetical protein